MRVGLKQDLPAGPNTFRRGSRAKVSFLREVLFASVPSGNRCGQKLGLPQRSTLYHKPMRLASAHGVQTHVAAGVVGKRASQIFV